MSHHHHDHGHQHPHIHGSDSKDYATANKEHYADAASSQENPKWIELAKRSAQAILARYPFDEESTSVMDFACNRGLLSREIAGYTKLLIGVDISQTPVDLFNEHVSNQGIPPDEMRAVCVELKGEEGELDGLKFDVITSIDDITKTLAFFLKPKGVLFVVDVTPKESDGISASDNNLFPEKFHHVVAHQHGLSESAIRTAFDGAGLLSFSFEPISSVKVHEREATLFIAKGVKPEV
ncbi:putative methyltransferase C1347.09 [Psilocybe cubensis]|uniref:Methyltransferase C1347.09 n=1 Tax=Psilocybe cubensis TaxID=181762 RepID=A0ACB8HA67_PSICU|nr:putative methyltransferase C1347.09 [Psilocybe cubensis]KAH9484055.1 putative methyltransferase C1347.09 [Psilocybe cubensis]